MARPIVETSYGAIEGVNSKNIEGEPFLSFKGIPYAKPPIGDLRFTNPSPPEPWAGVKKAYEFGSKCAQKDAIFRNIDGSDDCLYLNIYTKMIDCNANQPVIFWIHGGGLFYGQGDDYFYGAEYLLRKYCNLVLVTINYRLGVFGFLNLQHKVATGNQGLKDQVMALKWVKQNISNFGGDPDNITIAGGSAGAACVHYLCLSPLSKGLFHKAIMQSGIAGTAWPTPSNTVEHAHRLCEYFGRKITDPTDISKFLKSIDCQKLADAQHKILTEEEILQLNFTAFLPSVDIESDEPFLPEPIDKLVQTGIQVPLIIGLNTFEGLISLVAAHPKMFDVLNENFSKFVSPQLLKQLENYNLTPMDIKKRYFGSEKITKKTHLENYLKMIGDLFGNLSFHDAIRIQVEKNINPTYMYHFAYDKGFSIVKEMVGCKHIKGSCHFDEKAYLFTSKVLQKYGIANFRKGTRDYKIMEYMTAFWYNFAKYGCPTPEDSKDSPIKWDPVSDSKRISQLIIDEELKMESIDNICDTYRNKNL